MIFFFNEIGSDTALALAAKEATFAYHTAVHRQSFKSSDCKLVSQRFEPKFSLGRTKCKTVVVDVISPICTDELRQELNQVNFVATTIDASNMKK